MVTRESLRDLMGHAEFDAAVEFYHANKTSADSHNDHPMMECEPENRGLTIEQARDALERASTRSFDLPHINQFAE
jgi:hypothetical protein